ncbi:MAG: hypothetical protein IPN86_07890 [Saprospiraceae bacterium]|nr:hypothetical protein [Saprospiraceae bacterium]
MRLSAVNIAAGWVYNAATREVRTTYRNVLSAGASVQLMLDNRVVPCYTNVGRAWTNWAEIESGNDNDPNTPNPPVDIDSTPDNNNNNDPEGNRIRQRMMRSMAIRIIRIIQSTTG